MKYIDVKTVVESYNGFQDCMTNKSWGYLALLKGCSDSIHPLVPYEVNMDVVSNFLEGIFNLSPTKRQYDGGRSLYVVFSNKWKNYFNDQGRNTPNIYDVAIWAYRRNAFPDDITEDGIISDFSKEFNIPYSVIKDSFDTHTKRISFSNTLYPESILKSELRRIGVDVSRENIDAKKGGFVASPGEISRGPFVQPLYAGLDITDYVLILQSNYNSLYGGKSSNVVSKKDKTLFSRQQIYYGAPGTGKSHRIKEIIQENGIDEKEQVFRTTFHPDSDYSTFVGCYKPIMKSLPQTYVVEGKEKPVIDMATGKQSEKEEIVYDYTPQAFIQAYTKAWAKPGKPVILVIEEINRGNCAQIFGDIFQLLDRGDDNVSDYEIKPEKALEDYLKSYFAKINDVEIPERIKSGEIMKLPSNLYIWATMNTSDQSLFPIDSAFKRRWDWVYMPIDTKKEVWHIKVGGVLYSWTAFLEKINNEILTDETAEDKHLGFYFCKAENNEITQETFVGKVLFYLWNDVFKVYGIPPVIGSSKEWAYTKFYNTDGKVNEQKVMDLMAKLQIIPEEINENAAKEVSEQ